jgi:hypothetical protein
MRKLIATKTHTYGTRRLKAGDEFVAPGSEARLWVALGKARYAASSLPPDKPQTPPPPVRSEPEPAVAAAVERMESLRAQAERLGIEVDGRWGTIRLQQEIAKARG